MIDTQPQTASEKWTFGSKTRLPLRDDARLTCSIRLNLYVDSGIRTWAELAFILWFGGNVRRIVTGLQGALS